MNPCHCASPAVIIALLRRSQGWVEGGAQGPICQVSQSGSGELLYLTSNDCAYQSLTRPIDGISFRPSGRSLSSCTRCAKRMGSSSERNCEARKRVPVEGLSPNCTICRRETPEETLDGMTMKELEYAHRWQEIGYNATTALAVDEHCVSGQDAP